MCRIRVLQQTCCNQVLIAPVQRCSAPYPCTTLSIGRSWVSTPCTSCKVYGSLGHFIEFSGVKGYHIWFLNQDENKRVKLAIDEVIKAAGCTGSKWDFILRIDSPMDEKEIIALEGYIKEFPGVLKAAILKAESDTRDGEDFVNLLGKMSLYDGTETQERPGRLCRGRLLPASEIPLGLGGQDEDLAAELERLLLI